MFKKVLFVLVFFGFFPITGYTGTCPLTITWKNINENEIEVDVIIETRAVLNASKE